MTQGQLADLSGISRRTIIRWENADVSPWVPELASVIEALRLSSEEVEELTMTLTSNRAKREFDPARTGRLALLLKLARNRSGLSHAALAQHFDCDPTTVRRWESGRLSPSPSEIDKLFEVLQISDGELSGLMSDSLMPPKSEVELITAIESVLAPKDGSDIRLFDAKFLRLLDFPTVTENKRWQAHVHGAYAWKLMARHRHREAVHHAENAKQLFEECRKPGDRALLAVDILLARCHSGASKVRGPKLAIRILDGLDKRPLDWQLLSHRMDVYSEIYTRTGAFTRALAYSDRALASAKNSGPKVVKLLSFNRARIHLAEGKPDDALGAIVGLSDSTPLINALEAHSLFEIHNSLEKKQEAQHWSSLAVRISRQLALDHSFFEEFLWSQPFLETW